MAGAGNRHIERVRNGRKKTGLRSQIFWRRRVVELWPHSFLSEIWGLWGENLGRCTVPIRTKVFRYELPFVRSGVIGAWRNWMKKSAVARKPPEALDPVQDRFESPLHYDLSLFEMVD
jgi:hypothetical protein